MARDYVTIPGMCGITTATLVAHILPIATSVDVERLFSRGRLILPHTRSGLSVTSTRALLCLGSWSRLGLVRDEDVKAVMNLNNIDAQTELNQLGNILRTS